MSSALRKYRWPQIEALKPPGPQVHAGKKLFLPVPQWYNVRNTMPFSNFTYKDDLNNFALLRNGPSFYALTKPDPFCPVRNLKTVVVKEV